MQLFHFGFQRGAAHAIAHQQQVQHIRPAAARILYRRDDGLQALGGGKSAGKHQVEPPAELRLQSGIRLRNGVKILAVLRDHSNFLRRHTGALAQPLLQRLTHGNQSVGLLI